MIKTSTTLLFIILSFFLKAQTVSIPDANFKKALVDNPDINTNGDGEILVSEAIFTKEIDVSNKNISDLTGIEYFINITHLNCSYNHLTSVDLSQNTALTYLNCRSGMLTSLDISKNTEITNLDCICNELIHLYLNTNIAITELLCSYNQLTSLDLSKNKKITKLNCNYNKLTSLDLSKNTEITNLDCICNELIHLYLNTNIAITELLCSYNQLTSLDLSKNTEITNLDCCNNLLTNLYLNTNTAIAKLDCKHNLFLFSELLKIKNHYSKLNYTSTKKVFSPILEASGFELDYSAEALIDGTETVFTWYDFNDNIIDETFVSKTGTGVYKFLKAGPFYCRMTNSTFPATELITETTTIIGEEQTINISDIPNQVKVKDKLELKISASSKLPVNLKIIQGNATLTNNTLVFNSSGIVKIKASQAGDNIYFPITKTIEITVNRKEQCITFENNPAVVKIDDVIELNATSNLGFKISFEILSGDATLNGNNITFNKAGTVIIKGSQAGNDEYEACEKTIEITVDYATGIEEILETSTQIYPNPVETEMIIKFTQSEERTIRIFDLQGRLKLEKQTSSNTERLNLSEFKSGLYLMRVQAKSKTFTYKIIKK